MVSFADGMVITVALVLLTSLAASVFLTPALRSAAHRHGVLDRPNERSSHSIPTPRTGGIAIVAGIVLGALVGRIWSEPELGAVLACGLVIAILGFVDDVRTLGPGVKFIVHALAALAVATIAGLALSSIEVPFAGSIALPLGGFVLTLLWIVGFTNAYNFMDGINGIAALQAIVAAVVYAVLSARSEDLSGVVLAVAIGAGCAGFLFFNFPGGSIFMGDVGSGTVGFLLACEAIRVSMWGVPVIAAVLPAMPFVLDTSVTLVRRLLRRERIYTAHRSHFYQRLTQLGWSHAKVTMLWTSLAAACSIASVAYVDSRDGVRVAILAALVALHAVLFVAISSAERRAGGKNSLHAGASQDL